MNSKFKSTLLNQKINGSYYHSLAQACQTQHYPQNQKSQFSNILIVNINKWNKNNARETRENKRNSIENGRLGIDDYILKQYNVY